MSEVSNKSGQQVLMSIFRLANRLQVEGDKISDELTLKQWVFLYLLYQSDKRHVTLNDVAALMGVSRQSVKKMSVILKRDGYLTVVKSKQDNRALDIYPTSKAKTFFTQNKQLGSVLIKEAFNGIEEDEIKILLCILEKIQGNLGGSKNV